MSRLGPSSRSPMSDSVRSSSRSSIRSDTGGHLARRDLAQTRDRPREARLYGAARDVERIGHLGLGELHEVAVRDDQTILLAQFSERAEHERTPLARKGRFLGRQGRVTRGAVLGDAEIDRRSPAGRLAAVLGLVRDDPEQPGAERRAGPEAPKREVRLGDSVLRAIHEYSVLRRPALHGVGSHPSYNRPAKRFPGHAETSASSSRTRRSTPAMSALSIPSTLKSSTANDAHTVP